MTVRVRAGRFLAALLATAATWQAAAAGGQMLVLGVGAAPGGAPAPSGGIAAMAATMSVGESVLVCSQASWNAVMAPLDRAHYDHGFIVGGVGSEMWTNDTTGSGGVGNTPANSIPEDPASSGVGSAIFGGSPAQSEKWSFTAPVIAGTGYVLAPPGGGHAVGHESSINGCDPNNASIAGGHGVPAPWGQVLASATFSPTGTTAPSYAAAPNTPFQYVDGGLFMAEPSKDGCNMQTAAHGYQYSVWAGAEEYLISSTYGVALVSPGIGMDIDLSQSGCSKVKGLYYNTTANLQSISGYAISLGGNAAAYGVTWDENVTQAVFELGEGSSGENVVYKLSGPWTNPTIALDGADGDELAKVYDAQCHGNFAVLPDPVNGSPHVGIVAINNWSPAHNSCGGTPTSYGFDFWFYGDAEQANGFPYAGTVCHQSFASYTGTFVANENGSVDYDPLSANLLYWNGGDYIAVITPTNSGTCAGWTVTQVAVATGDTDYSGANGWYRLKVLDSTTTGQPGETFVEIGSNAMAWLVRVQ